MSKKSKLNNTTMNKIKNSKTHMKPKIFFSIISILWIILAIVLGAISVYTISAISFWLRIVIAQGPAYGAKRNLSFLIESFPWWLILVSCILIFVIIYVMRKHSNLYKIKLSILIPTTLIALLLAGYFLSYSNLIVHHANYNQKSNHQKMK